ncbi:hypothetical protein LRM36_05115 [Stenotrophomonas maltophilia]|nr:hypothetical protein [Stenotrophomonas maltophilia]
MADRFPGEQPNWNEPIADQSGRATLAWRNYFLRLASVQSSEDLRALYEALAARVAALEDGESIDFQILGQGSVSVNGVPQPGNVVVISLQGDTALPGNTQYYGTGPTGAKGWFPVSGAITVNGGELTKTVGTDGVVTLGLADVPDSGAGTLLATTFDAKGRKTGSKPATITGTAQQINVANGNAAAGLPTLSLAAEVTASLGKADTALQPGAVHNTALSGLQGGSSTERYHSTAIQNSSLAAVAVSGEICGLQMVWNSGTSITFTSGFAAIQSLGGLLSFPSPITKAGLSLSASTWYHAYGYSNAGTPDVEIVTTAPASTSFSGTARSKTSDPSRRYLGSIRTDAAGQIYRFRQVGDQIFYMAKFEDAPFRVLANGQQTTYTTVALSAIVPVTAPVATLGITNVDPAVGALYSNDSGASYEYTCNPNFFQGLTVPMNSASEIQYKMIVTPTAGLYIDCLGYTYER